MNKVGTIIKYFCNDKFNIKFDMIRNVYFFDLKCIEHLSGSEFFLSNNLLSKGNICRKPFLQAHMAANTAFFRFNSFDRLSLTNFVFHRGSGEIRLNQNKLNN